MLKHARRPVGFYASRLKSNPDAIFRKKYRPTLKARVMVFFMVERVIMKRLRGNHAEFFVKCKNYSRLENTWEPSEHLLGDLIPDFESMPVDGHGTSVRGGIKTSLQVLSEAHNERRWHPVPVSEDTDWSLWQSVPCGWRGACGGGAGIFFEEVLDCDRGRPCEALHWQVTPIPGRARPQVCSAPSREGPSDVHKKLLHWDWGLKPSINKTAPLGATKRNKS